MLLPAFRTPTAPARCSTGACPARRVGDHLVTTVFDLMLAQYGVRRDGLPGDWPSGYDDAATPYTPAWQAGDHRRAGRAVHPGRPRVRRERRGVPRAFDDHHGRRHLPVVPRRRDVPGDPLAARPHRVHGPQRRRLGALRRPGEVPPDHRLDLAGQRARLDAATADHDRHRVLVHAHRPVAQRRLLGRLARLAAGQGHLAGMHTADTIAQSARLGWMPFYPQFSANPLEVAEDAQAAVDDGAPPSPAAYVARPCTTAASGPPSRTSTPRRTGRAPWSCGARTSWAPRPRATSTSSSTCWAPTRTSWAARTPRRRGRPRSRGARRRRRASSTCCCRRTSG